jgi:FkbH-like protein
MPFRFAISATFTAEPIEPVLSFWGRQLDVPCEIRFAPYNQIVQTLTDPAGEFAANQHGLNVLLIRLEDLVQFDAVTLARMEANLDEVIRLVREALPRMGVPLIFALCPPSPGRRQFAHEMALRIESMLEGTPGILYLSHEEIQQLYPVDEAWNEQGERLGNIAYTELYFCALGTALVRLMHGLFSPPFKVIALDCDDTLWKGICGEDGPRGVTLDAPRRALQEFMKEQQHSGMLLAMASKNNEADVLETFSKHPEMPLQMHHFVASRLNWDAKSANLSALGNELSLGLDSFILVDDNPKECAEVAESVPEVLALALPAETGEIAHFLDHVWAFDHVLVTEEDRNRSAHYKTALEFGRELRQASNLESFLSTLELRVQIKPCEPGELVRVAQLTERTNQFNFTTIRRSAAEIGGLLAGGKLECLTVDVSDRFGDYGLTGVVLFRPLDWQARAPAPLRVDVGQALSPANLLVDQHEDALEIDTLLLSCRVLGRGVEHRVLAHLAQEALRRGLSTVTASLRLTAKNEPARRFLHEIGARFERETESGFSYLLPATEMSDLRWRPSKEVAAARVKTPQPAPHKRPDYAHIARALSTPMQILNAVRRSAAREQGDENTDARLAQIWSELLKKPAIAAGDNFFDLGGHSLLAVLLIVRVRETFGVELTIDDVYSANLTLGELAAKIERNQLGDGAVYDALYKEIDALSDDEVKALLAAEDPGVSLS